MMKRYNIRAGIIFSFLIAVLASFPRLIRLDFDQLGRFASNAAYGALGIFVCWLIHHFFLLTHFERSYYNKKTPRAIISILSGIIATVILSYAGNITGIMRGTGAAIEDMSTLQVFFIRLFRGAIISSFTFFTVYYFRLTVSLQRSRLENEHLKQENLKAQLASLKEQISPHFLFNSLNTLSTLSHEQPVKDYVLKMSEVYRYVLHHQQQQEVLVKDELAFIESYSYILESRFEDGIRIDTRIDHEKLKRKILSFSLQLLIENAVKHNTVSFQRPLAITVYDTDNGLIVENNLRPKTTLEKQSGTGLANLSQRYRLASGKDITITTDQQTFKVEIPFL